MDRKRSKASPEALLPCNFYAVPHCIGNEANESASHTPCRTKSRRTTTSDSLTRETTAGPVPCAPSVLGLSRRRRHSATITLVACVAGTSNTAHSSPAPPPLPYHLPFRHHFHTPSLALPRVAFQVSPSRLSARAGSPCLSLNQRRRTSGPGLPAAAAACA